MLQYNPFDEEVNNFISGGSGYGFHDDPFCKVVNYNNDILIVCHRFRKRSNQVYSNSFKRFSRIDRSQKACGSLKGSLFHLTINTRSYVLDYMIGHFWPIVSTADLIYSTFYPQMTGSCRFVIIYQDFFNQRRGYA
jgi:hypothetical protein